MDTVTKLTRPMGTLAYTEARHFHMVNAGWMSLHDFTEQNGRMIDVAVLGHLVDQFLERHDPMCTRVFAFKNGTCLYPAILLRAVFTQQWTPKTEGPCPISVSYQMLDLPDIADLADKLPISAEVVAFFQSLSDEARHFLFRSLDSHNRLNALGAKTGTERWVASHE